MIFFKLNQNERKQDDCHIDVYNVSNVTFMSVKYSWKQKKYEIDEDRNSNNCFDNLASNNYFNYN